MKLRIYHIINIPGEAFHFEVPDTATAIRTLKAIAQYDLFLGDGDDKPWTTVGGRQKKRAELAGRDPMLHSMFAAYNAYQLRRCPGGVPLVFTNVQGCEVLEDGEWCEFEDEDGNNIRDLEEMSLETPLS
jgi:hypothetical protein